MTAAWAPVACNNPLRMAENEPKFREWRINDAGPGHVRRRSARIVALESTLPSSTKTSSISLDSRPRSAVSWVSSSPNEPSLLNTGMTMEKISFRANPLEMVTAESPFRANGIDNDVLFFLRHAGKAGKGQHAIAR